MLAYSPVGRVALIYVVPAFTAFTKPFSETVAMDFFVLVHLALSVEFSISVPSCSSFPFFSVMEREMVGVVSGVKV